MLSRDTLDQIPDVIANRISGANEYMLKLLGNNIKRLGKITDKDVHRIEEMYRAGVDIAEVEKEIAKRTKKAAEEVKALFDAYAAENLARAYDAYKYRGETYIPYDKNDYLQKFVESYSRRTANTLFNLSQTHALRIFSAKQNKFVAFADGYKDAIDQAVTNTALGVQDYQSAMRDTIKKVGENGICTMEYESGYVRRLDSAVRMNVLEGVRQVNQGIEDQIGEQLGADGVEISAHGYCAPDHEDIQGKQMTKAEYAKWDAAHAYPKRQIGKLNCHHFAFSVILGVQEPIHTPEELDEMKKKNAAGMDYEGKHYTMYQATQIQRQLETDIRKCQDVHIMAQAAGDTELQRKMQNQINLLKNKYVDFSQKAGLNVYSRRMKVEGYKPSGKGLTSANRGGIITSGAVSGARNPYGKKAEKHAVSYYDSVRSMKNDVETISKNTGMEESAIRKVKNYIFFDKHNLGNGQFERFAPDYMMAESWKRLIDGKPKPHDLTLLRHELLEESLIKQGHTQSEAHLLASEKFNYSKEAKQFYDSITKYKKE